MDSDYAFRIIGSPLIFPLFTEILSNELIFYILVSILIIEGLFIFIFIFIQIFIFLFIFISIKININIKNCAVLKFKTILKIVNLLLHLYSEVLLMPILFGFSQLILLFSEKSNICILDYQGSIFSGMIPIAVLGIILTISIGIASQIFLSNLGTNMSYPEYKSF